MTETPISRQKSDLRDSARQARHDAARAASAKTHTDFSKKLIELLGNIQNWQVISGYLPIGDEIDPNPVLDYQRDRGKICVLPVVASPDAPLNFRVWKPGVELESGPLNTRHPAVGADEMDPDVLLVPLLAFARDGFRIGWGGGFYDRTLEMYINRGRSICGIGIAYAGQEVDFVPHEYHDQPLNYIVTENEIITVEKVRS